MAAQMAASTSSFSADALRIDALRSGKEARVEVNQRLLIDKMLARYSSQFVVARELIQNADDAGASKFTLALTVGADLQLLELKAENNGRLFTANDWERVAMIAEGNPDESTVGMFGVGFYSVFSLTESPVITSGDRMVAFVWKGTQLTTFGAQLRPDQVTDKTCVLMKIRDDGLVVDLSGSDQDTHNFGPDGAAEVAASTSRAKRATKSVVIATPTIDFAKLKTFFTKVASFTKTVNELCITVNNTLVYRVTKKRDASIRRPLARTLRSESNFFELREVTDSKQTYTVEQWPWPDIDGVSVADMITPKVAEKKERKTAAKKSGAASSASSSSSSLSSSHSNGLVSSATRHSLTLHHMQAAISVTLDDAYHLKCQRIMKKKLPSTTVVQILFPSSSSDATNASSGSLAANLSPLDERGVPAGRVFIGLGTHQTTGSSYHVHAQLIPTIERENVDYQDPYLGRWNSELTMFVGEIARASYDYTIASAMPPPSEKKKTTAAKKAAAAVANGWNMDDAVRTAEMAVLSVAMAASTPSAEVGKLLVEGFFRNDSTIMVPTVSRTPSLAIVSSREAYLPKHDIESFVPGLPVVSSALLTKCGGFFRALEQRQLIKQLSATDVEAGLQKSVLDTRQLIALLRWFCKLQATLYGAPKKASAARGRKKVDTDAPPAVPGWSLLANITWIPAVDEAPRSFAAIRHFDMASPTSLPLPPSVLPPAIAAELSAEQLNVSLGLTSLPLSTWIRFVSDTASIIESPKYAPLVLAHLSRHWGLLGAIEGKSAIKVLSTKKCIPTSDKKQPMQTPGDAYFKSDGLPANLPQCTLTILNDTKDDGNNDSESAELKQAEKDLSAKRNKAKTDKKKKKGVINLASSDDDENDMDERDDEEDGDDDAKVERKDSNGNANGLDNGTKLAVSQSLLKRLGVRTLPSMSYILAGGAERKAGASSRDQLSMAKLITGLLEQSRQFSDKEWTELKDSKCLRAVGNAALHRPSDLHLPSVGDTLGDHFMCLEWDGAPLAADGDIVSFLKRLGVLEVPDMTDLLTLAADSDAHAASSAASPALTFFIKHFKKHYAGGYKPKAVNKIAFLPAATIPPDTSAAAASSSSSSSSSSSVDITKKKRSRDDAKLEKKPTVKGEAESKRAAATTSPQPAGDDWVFEYCTLEQCVSDRNPFIPVIAPSVVALCTKHGVDLTDQLGVRAHPTLQQVLTLLAAHPPTPVTARSIFSYLYTHVSEGFTAVLLDKMSKSAFIPVGDQLLTPMEVCIKPGASSEPSSSNGKVTTIADSDDDDEEVEVPQPKKARAKRGAAAAPVAPSSPPAKKSRRATTVASTKASATAGSRASRAATKKAEKAEDSLQSLASSSLNLEGLIDYVDFGYEANLFLKCGRVAEYPTPTQLALAVMKNCERYVALRRPNNNDDDKESSSSSSSSSFSSSAAAAKKLSTPRDRAMAYISILKYLFSVLDQVDSRTQTAMKKSRWAIALQKVTRGGAKEGKEVKRSAAAAAPINNDDDDNGDGDVSSLVSEQALSFQLPSAVYLSDNDRWERLLKPWCAPGDLYDLYERFGARWLQTAVTCTSEPRGRAQSSKRSVMIQNTIRQRLPLLLINKRMERRPDVKDSAADLLRTSLLVMEAPTIDVQLTFENKTVACEGELAPSVVLIMPKKRVKEPILYLSASAVELDYFDIATEIAAALFNNHDEALVDLLTLRLQTPLAQLLRRGVPVDRLLQIDLRRGTNGAAANGHDNGDGSDDDNGDESKGRQVKLGQKITDFSKEAKSSSKKLASLLGASRPHKGDRFEQEDSYDERTDTQCEAIQGWSGVRQRDTFNGIPLFIDEKHGKMTPELKTAATRFGALLSSLAANVFNCRKDAFHMYWEKDASRIAFAQGGSVWFSLRYYIQVHNSGAQHDGDAATGLGAAAAPYFWFTTACHEFAHNGESGHNAIHENLMEGLIAQHMPAFMNWTMSQ